MIELGTLYVASDEGLTFCREKLLMCLREAGISTFYAGKIVTIFSQKARSAFPFSIQISLGEDTLYFSPQEIFGAQASVSTQKNPNIAELRRILSLKSQEELMQDLENQVVERTKECQQERERAEQLLYAAIPRAIALRLKNNEIIADQFTEVSILFVDIVDFTLLSSKMLPVEIVSFLSKICHICDELAETHHVQKIKIIGDRYMAATGLPEPQRDHLQRIIFFSLAVINEIRNLKYRLMMEINVRIGIHTGEVIAGVIGEKQLAYDVWGNTVNIASRMESEGRPGRIHVTETVFNRMKDQFQFEERGIIYIKGEGPMKTYFLLS